VTVAIPGCKVQRFRICVGNRPEDIQQWIAERKKRFPRIQQKQEEKVNASSEDTKNIHSATGQSTAKSGVAALLEGYGSSSEEEEELEKKEEAEIAGEVTTQNDTTTSEATATTTTTVKDHPPGYRTRPCRFFARFGQCRNGEACRFLHEQSNGNARSNQPPLHEQQQQEPLPQTRPQKQQQHPRKDTPKGLLRSLLAKDMQRETTLTLQLLRYIVDHDFFQNDSHDGGKGTAVNEG
jgi:Zinc finger C-x8-C-x5-C-x3-H type (and similar)/Nuclear fragile X mental retardation-interacting protein 1 (NUFIP1)